ncbi:MAG: hypothetical protein ABI249_00060 [Ornithinibacter sp.]
MSTPGAMLASQLARASAWAMKAPAKRVGAPVGAVALAVSGVFGGLAPAQASYADAGQGAVIESGPFEVSVQRVRAIDDLKPYVTPEAGNRLLVVVVKVRNTTDEPVSALLLSRELQVAPTGARLAPPVLRSPVSMKDFSAISELQPDLTYDAAVLLETTGEDVATQVSVGIPGYTWREDSFTPGSFEWKDPTTIAKGTYPVKDVRDETPTGEAQ